MRKKPDQGRFRMFLGCVDKEKNILWGTDMKTIYIFLTKSTTICSRLIYIATRSEFTHAAISLDDSFDKLYTFSRKHRYLPLPAGFMTESMYDGIMGDSDNMRCGVYKLNITNNTYSKLETILNDMESYRSKYRYSILGLLFCWFNKAFEREDHCFCSQFVYRALSESEAIQHNRPSSLVRPVDLPDLSGAMEVFKGTIGDLRLNGLMPMHGEASVFGRNL